jgi:hypothetical protein
MWISFWGAGQGNYKFARYLGNRVLELNLGNKYVLGYLDKMKDK